MAILGDKSKDYKWWYPDNTGFQFDVAPRNVAMTGREIYNGDTNSGNPTTLGSDDGYYSPKYLCMPWNDGDDYDYFGKSRYVNGYAGYLNWLHKYEFDPRFLQVSDKNANLYQFPEVEFPFKFTEYIFKGMDNDIVIEPPLYNPGDLSIINGIFNLEKDESNSSSAINKIMENSPNIFRKEGKLKSEGYDKEKIDNVYYYRCVYSKEMSLDDIKNGKKKYGPRRKQYEPDDTLREKNGDLESGLIIRGIKYQPWTDPEAHPLFMNTFEKTGEICGVRKTYLYKSANRADVSDINGNITSSGVRLYRKDIRAKCVDIGQHGNIPKETINMSAPKGWLSPETMYRNVLVPVLKANFASSVYSTGNGIVEYTNENITYTGAGNIYLKTIASWNSTMSSFINGHELEKFIPTLSGDKILQPKPDLGINNTLYQNPNCISVASKSTNDFINRGCTHFIGNSVSGCYCNYKKNLLENNDFNFTGLLERARPSLCSSYSQSGEALEITDLCKFYQPNSKVELMSFTVNNISTEGVTKLYNSWVTTTNELTSDIGYVAGLAGGGVGALAAARMNIPQAGSGNTTFANGANLNYTISYEFKRVDANGREIKSSTPNQKSMVQDNEYVVKGTGKFAFDTKSTGYGGVDSNIFTGTNLMSRHRFNSCIMHCYNEGKCNLAYGMVNMNSGMTDGIFAGVGNDDSYCRYYNQGCPTTEVNQRAREYDREYKKLIDLVLKPFRLYGIEGFSGLFEYKIAKGVYAAIGYNSELDSIMSHLSTNDQRIYFLYDRPFNSYSNSDSSEESFPDDREHVESNVFGFIRQYGRPVENSPIPVENYLKMNSSKYPGLTIPSIFMDSEISWLVKLHDDYVSPSKFESYVTNVLPFMGGRMPEYKDFSKIGEEIASSAISPVNGVLYNGYSGTVGMYDSEDMMQEQTTAWYRVDRTGEWIIEDLSYIGDGKSLGSVPDISSRGMLPPSSGDSIPVAGRYSIKKISSTGDEIQGVVLKGWVYAADTNETISECFIEEDGRREGLIPVNTVSGTENIMPYLTENSQLPSGRLYYYCPVCSEGLYDEPDDGTTKSELNAYGEKPIRQIFTDFEYEHYKYCPRCASVGVTTELKLKGNWEFFPKCRAEGTVNYFGLPGEIVDGSGYFWKNHTEVSRSFISELISKNGEIVDGRFTFEKDKSANQETESSVYKFRQLGSHNLYGYRNEISHTITPEEAIYTETDEKISKDVWKPLFMTNNEQPSSEPGKDGRDKVYFNDRYKNPYALSINGSKDGLPFVSTDLIKNIRNYVQPIMGYPCFTKSNDIVNIKKQAGNKNRFSETDKDDSGLMTGFESFVLASNDSHSVHNWIQYSDKTVYPGKVLYAYYPTSPLWWFRKNYIGGIRRKGGRDILHMNDETSHGPGPYQVYTGNLTSNSYHMLHGWLPHDKEVIGAVVKFTPVDFPEEPPLGRVVQGGPKYDCHWHSFLPDEWPDTKKGESKKIHDARDAEILNSVMHGEGLNQAGIVPSGDYNLNTVDYWSVLYDDTMWKEDEKVITSYSETSFGFDISQGFLSWGGFNTDIVQELTEDEIWKEFTFEEFNNLMAKKTISVRMQFGNETIGTSSYEFSVMPKEIADGFANNGGQAITNAFDYSGLNTSLVYSKYGMKNAEKTYDSSWAEGGKVIVQGEVGAQASGNPASGGNSNKESGSALLSGANTKLGIEIQYSSDALLNMVKKLYDTRIGRAFKAFGGKTYNEFSQWFIDNKINYINEDEPPKEFINYRHINDTTKSFWISSAFLYPELEDGEFPTILSGDEYFRSPMSIINLEKCGEWEYPVSNAETYYKIDSTKLDYYKYSPYCLVSSSSGIPAGSRYIQEDGDIKIDLVNEISGEAEIQNICKLSSYYNDGLYIEMNLSKFPTEKSRRPYRYQKGYWDVSNAICNNESCFVAKDGKTVAEAAAISNSGLGQYRKYSFLTNRTKCAVCGKFIADIEHGAQYIAGDGITTISYANIPKRDCIVDGIVIDISSSSNEDKKSFNVYSRSSISNTWNLLFSARWNKDTGKWRYSLIQSGNITLSSEQDSLPSIFRGKWIDGNIQTSFAEANGYNFIATRAEAIKVVFIPDTVNSSGNDLENGGRTVVKTDILPLANTTGDNKFKINIVGLTNLQIDSYVEFFEPNSSEPIDTVQITDYNENTGEIILERDIPEVSNSNSESESLYYRIIYKRYKVSINKIQAYGYEVVDDCMKLTDDVTPVVYKIRPGVNSYKLPDRASKILSVTAIGKMGTVFQFIEHSDDIFRYSSDLYYKVKKLKTGKYEILQGYYSYDTDTNSIFLPEGFVEVDDISDNSGALAKISNVFDENLDINSCPISFEVRYMTGNGTECKLDIESIGHGPSYMIDRDNIRFIYGHNSGQENIAYDKEIQGIYGNMTSSWTSDLPQMGSSVIFRRSAKREKLSWTVFNEVKTRYSGPKKVTLSGKECLSDVTQNGFDSFMGFDEKDNGLPNDVTKRQLISPCFGQITLKGLPNSLISGILYVYAPANVVSSKDINGDIITTYERTGGMRYTGFVIDIKDIMSEFMKKNPDASKFLFCMAMTKPELIVYLRDRSITEKLNVST